MIEKEEGGDFQSLSRIQRWFEINCDGDWENNYGVLIDTVGNPGWSVEIDLSSTILERVEFTEIKENYEDETSWLFVNKADNVLFVLV